MNTDFNAFVDTATKDGYPSACSKTQFRYRTKEVDMALEQDKRGLVHLHGLWRIVLRRGPFGL